MEAIENRDALAVRLIVESITRFSSYYQSAIDEAIDKGFPEAVDLLLEKFPDRLPIGFMDSRFLIASGVGVVETMKVLLERGADIEAKNVHDTKALTFAASKGQMTATIFLMDNGLDPYHKDKTGQTVISRAQGAGHHEVAKVMQAYAEERLLNKSIVDHQNSDGLVF